MLTGAVFMYVQEMNPNIKTTESVDHVTIHQHWACPCQCKQEMD